MTRFDIPAVLPKAPHLPSRRKPDVQAMLRDIAYVLHLTQKVKREILVERTEVAEVREEMLVLAQ